MKKVIFLGLLLSNLFVYSQLTQQGLKVAQQSTNKRSAVAENLLKGTADIENYVTGSSFNAVAYVRFLLGSSEININDLNEVSGQYWKEKFNFSTGVKWDGKSELPIGKAIGFQTVIDGVFFHAAIVTSPTTIKSVKGGSFGTNWKDLDLLRLLGSQNSDGTYTYNGVNLNIYISNL